MKTVLALQSTIQVIGIALIGFGLFGILMDTNKWREYFSERLKEVIIEQTYLDHLGVDVLKGLQVKVLKAFFKDQSIDQEGSFLNYFQTNLHKFISEPYREDVTAEIELQSETDGVCTIFDRVAYSCRKAGGQIQKNISWKSDPGEFEGVDALCIKIKFPYNHKERGREKILFDKSKDGLKNGDPIEIPLDEFKEVDQLVVIVEATYRVKSDRFQYWQMAHPTRNFTFIITHPQNFDLQLKPLVLEPENAQVSVKAFSSVVKYDSWMLPQSGVAWKFRKKSGLKDPIPETEAQGKAIGLASQTVGAQR